MCKLIRDNYTKLRTSYFGKQMQPSIQTVATQEFQASTNCQRIKQNKKLLL